MKLTYSINEQILLRDYLIQCNISKKSLSAIKRNGALFVNGKSVTVRYMLSAGDQLEVMLPEETPSVSLVPSDQPINILYEDAFLCIVSKPPYINTMPSQLHPHDSLIERVLHHFMNNGESGIPHIVTRLDRNTSGIVIFAKHQLVHHWMTGQVEKLYLCAVSGALPAAGIIDAPIKRKEGSIIERITSDDGKPSLTSYLTLHQQEDYSAVVVRLHTGRTHQIRVHFQSIGHPLIGDQLYGSDQSLGRQALHAFQVQFIHPLTKASVRIQDRPAKDVATLFPML